MAANNGTGSSIFFDYFFEPVLFTGLCCRGLCCICCCDCSGLVDEPTGRSKRPKATGEPVKSGLEIQLLRSWSPCVTHCSFPWPPHLSFLSSPCCSPDLADLHTDIEFWRIHLGRDFIAGSWLFLLFTILLLPWSLYYCVLYPTSSSTWLFFFSTIGLVWGTSLFVYTAYPENMYATWTWDTVVNALTCQKAPRLLDI